MAFGRERVRRARRRQTGDWQRRVGDWAAARLRRRLLFRDGCATIRIAGGVPASFRHTE
jgi:hypothetical protein